jgi:hypothetical protein
MLKCLQEFLEGFFLVVGMESLLGEEKVWMRQARITAQKGHNFWYDRWIALKFLQVFLKVVFLRVSMESLLGEKEVWTPHTRITAQKGLNF